LDKNGARALALTGADAPPQRMAASDLATARSNDQSEDIKLSCRNALFDGNLRRDRVGA
jgi:hypothetical protein